jgi:hypothetical protein
MAPMNSPQMPIPIHNNVMFASSFKGKENYQLLLNGIPDKMD